MGGRTSVANNPSVLMLTEQKGKGGLLVPTHRIHL
jgi:hypothetical protein